MKILVSRHKFGKAVKSHTMSHKLFKDSHEYQQIIDSPFNGPRTDSHQIFHMSANSREVTKSVVCIPKGHIKFIRLTDNLLTSLSLSLSLGAQAKQ